MIHFYYFQALNFNTVFAKWDLQCEFFSRYFLKFWKIVISLYYYFFISKGLNPDVLLYYLMETKCIANGIYRSKSFNKYSLNFVFSINYKAHIKQISHYSYFVHKLWWAVFVGTDHRCYITQVLVKGNKFPQTVYLLTWINRIQPFQRFNIHF